MESEWKARCPGRSIRCAFVESDAVGCLASSRMESSEAHVDAQPEHKPTIVEQIKEKVSAVKEKIKGHIHDGQSPAAAASAAAPEAESRDHDAHGHRHEHAREGIVLTERIERPIPEGGLILEAAPEDAVDPHHGLTEKIKNVFKFPVPDSTLTPTEDFEETVPPNLKI